MEGNYALVLKDRELAASHCCGERISVMPWLCNATYATDPVQASVDPLRGTSDESHLQVSASNGKICLVPVVRLPEASSGYT